MTQLPPEYEDAALAYAANILRTLSTTDPGEWTRIDKLAARRLDMFARGAQPSLPRPHSGVE